jgi:hypothetical protein
MFSILRTSAYKAPTGFALTEALEEASAIRGSTSYYANASATSGYRFQRFIAYFAFRLFCYKGFGFVNRKGIPFFRRKCNDSRYNGFLAFQFFAVKRFRPFLHCLIL